MRLKFLIPRFTHPALTPFRILGCLLGSTAFLFAPTPGFTQALIARAAPVNGASSPDAGTRAHTASSPRSFNSADWNSLTIAQRNALTPLTSSWANLSDGQKRKWITLSANYPRMSAAEQAKLHERMAQWAALSPRQRELARLNFAEAKQITPEQKNEKWQAYQALSPEEKHKLAKSAQPKPPRTALAAQPVASDKISRMPMTKKADGMVVPTPAASVSKNTLLVKPKPPTAPTPPKAPASTVTHGANPQ
ncbi:MAG: DUF3106 domain-containing protein [Rhodoferax sp.]|uniref:DUF3106 domain-containing protein n=1 Tax=Rhodoferax sp. TaxID=50421 RepID=UPI002603C4CF|nr:DUF3106 domain-containing protein [Rhodoferax sp.]MDD2879053.1 DUF3106 domain-containing protein [Rhodoferax sp.]